MMPLPLPTPVLNLVLERMTMKQLCPSRLRAPLLACLLGCAALPMPAAAITTAVAPGSMHAPAGHVQQGVVELVTPGSTLRVNGRAYVFSTAASTVYDRHGKRMSTPRVAAGQTVRFTVIEDGSQLRIKELWLAD